MDSLLSLDGGEAGSDQKKKKSLPPHITTPRKGPLLLQKAQQQTASSRSQQQTEVASYLKEKRRHYGNHPQAKLLKSGVRMCAPVRRGLLTRYPVMALTPKPMDAIEDHLMKGEMTWSQLKYNVQLMMEDGRGLTAEREGNKSAESAFLHHRMKYSSHGNDPLLAIERYTHSMSSANDPNSTSPETINVSITCSRVPQNVQQTSDLSTLKSSLTTAALSPPAQVTWRGAFKANSQLSREKERDLQKTSVSIHAQAMARPVSRVREESVYLANGIVKTDNHRRSTSLPRQQLVHPTGTGLKQAAKTTKHTHNTTDQSVAHKQRDNHTMPPSTQQTEEGELKPSESLQIYLSSHVGPSIAPAGVRAVATQRLRPVTTNTIIKGRGLVTAAR